MNTAFFNGAGFNPRPPLIPDPGGSTDPFLAASSGFNGAGATFNGARFNPPPGQVPVASRSAAFNGGTFNGRRFNGGFALPPPPLPPGTAYHVYRNNGAGGPVDYSSPIGTAVGLTFASMLAAPSDNKFAVRAFDTGSGLEDRNIDAVVRIVIDAAGQDITSQPNPPRNLSARPTAGGNARVEWDYNAAGQGGPPTGFQVWRTPGGSVDYAAAPALTIAYIPGVVHYRADLSGLIDGASYSIGARAFNASAAELNTTVVPLTGKVAGPAPVDNLLATASP